MGVCFYLLTRTFDVMPCLYCGCIYCLLALHLEFSLSLLLFISFFPVFVIAFCLALASGRGKAGDKSSPRTLLNHSSKTFLKMPPSRALPAAFSVDTRFLKGFGNLSLPILHHSPFPPPTSPLSFRFLPLPFLPFASSRVAIYFGSRDL